MIKQQHIFNFGYFRFIFEGKAKKWKGANNGDQDCNVITKFALAYVTWEYFMMKDYFLYNNILNFQFL